MATFTLRRVKRRGPKVVAPEGEWIMPAPGQWSRVLRVKPLDVVLRRLLKRLYPR